LICWTQIKQEVLDITNQPTYITFVNNKLSSLQRCDIAQNCRILHPVVRHLPQHIPKVLSNNIIVQIKIVGMPMILHCTKLNFYKCNGSWIVFIKQNMNFNFQLPSMYELLVYHKNGLNKSCSPFEDLSACKTLWSHIQWCKFCIHLRSLNVCHFGMVESTGLKSMALMSPSTACPPHWTSLLWNVV
jgi:hypothetical protein